MGISMTVGIGSPWIWNFTSLSRPFSVAILRVLLGYISIQAQLMFASNRRLVHAFVVVTIVISSIYTLIGGSCSLLFRRSLLTNHFDT